MEEVDGEMEASKNGTEINILYREDLLS